MMDGNLQTGIGYVRVSTKEQATEGVSLQAQRAKVVAYGSRLAVEGVNLVAEPEEQRAVEIIQRKRAAGGTIGTDRKSATTCGTSGRRALLGRPLGAPRHPHGKGQRHPHPPLVHGKDPG